jgi:PKD repeat protein
VTLTVSNAAGSASISRSIPVLVAITASFSFNPASPAAGQSVQFTDSSTGNPTLWQWSFGDGGTSAAQNPNHAFVAAGTYTVSLTIMNATGQDTVSRSVGVSAANAVNASYTYSPASPTAGQAVQFTDTSSGTPTSWLWNFNDGTTSVVQNPSHIFATAGAYSVNLMASNTTGANNITKTVVIASPSLPVAGFSFNPSNPVLGQTIQFSDASTGNPTSWQWNFGDGASSTAQNPSYTYSSPGTYTVTLTIRAGTNSDSTTKPVTIGNSDVITAASPSYSDVAAAIAAASTGGTVLVPAGSSTWPSPLLITKSISLIGAGQGQTIITSSYAGSGNTGNPNNWLISYVPSSPALDGAFRLSGFSLNCANLCGALGLFNTSVAYPQTKVRIDHITTTNARHSCIVSGPIYGVMDNCNLSQSAGVFFNFLFYSLDTIWANHIFTLGTPNNFYVEDCVLNCGLTDGGCTNGGFGQRYVIRHSTVNAQGHLMSCWDAHGNMGPGNGWSTQGIELYENTINAGNYMVIVFDHRGGRAAVWGNNLYNTASAGYQIREEYYDSGNPPAVAPDGQPQYPSGSYYWLNRKNNATVQTPSVTGTLDYPGLSAVPSENREFWVEKTSFTGSTGVGVGVLAARPQTGTVGVGYWATDAKKLYTWTTNNRWEEKYVPYAYPHPLRTTLSR